jgi:hypothetical protein
MRPDPADLIEGVRDLLRRTIAPELRSEQAILALRRIMVVLRDTDWNEAGFELMRENDVLRRLANDVIAWNGGAPSAAVESLRVLAEADAPQASYAAARALNSAYRYAFARLMDERKDAADLRGLLITRLAGMD